jgi:acyl-CoA thioester hydrolase
MDAYAHVNNGTYFTYLEDTRIHWLQYVKTQILIPDEARTVLLKVGCTFLKSLYFPSVLEVAIFKGALGGSSFDLSYTISTVENQELCTTGESKTVWTHKNTGRPMPVPPAFKRFFEEL